MKLSVNNSHSSLYIAQIGGGTLLGLFFLFLLETPVMGAQTRTIDIAIGTNRYRLELAQTPEQRRLGLMYRRRLEPDRGMLLVYGESGDHRIWMKNVSIPLRVYWIDSNFEVIKMLRLEPCVADPCPSYSSPRPSRYVLELSDDEHDLAPGDRIDGLSRLPG